MFFFVYISSFIQRQFNDRTWQVNKISILRGFMIRMTNLSNYDEYWDTANAPLRGKK